MIEALITMAFVPIKREVLRIGLYIKIEGSWFSHPFPTNSFKIKTSKELETLRGLTRVQLFFDPDRSDTATMEKESSATCLVDPSDISNTVPTREGAATSQSTDISPKNETSWQVNPDCPPYDPIDRKIAQRQAFQTYQKHLQQVSQQFQAVVKDGKQMVQDAICGRPRGLRTAKKIVENLFDLVGEHDHSRALLNLMGSDDTQEEFFLHALNVCSLSLLIATDFGLKREEKEKMALGALFHDVGELKFPVEKLLRKGSMDPNELKTFLSAHPKYGEEIVEKWPNFPYEATEIIRQHHERLNGAGFPLGKKDEQISTLAKIVMVADEYDELCHHPDPQQALAPPDALSHLYVKCRQTLWQDAVVALIRQLGVYPPGSLIQLNNQKIGIVTSVNFEHRLRPIILVYDEHGSSDEPIVLNLAEEVALSIACSIRPMDLAPKIRKALNPRKIISYFPSAPTLELHAESFDGTAVSRA